MRPIKVLQAHAPGLGDNLIYRTLVRLYRSAGYDVWISTLPAPGHMTAFRNEGIRQLCWASDPAVSGFIDEPGEIGNLFKPLDHRYIKLAKEVGPIAAVEKLHGFDPTGWTTPQIAYVPKRIPELRDVVIIDPNSVSQYFPGEVLVDYYAWVQRWHDIGQQFLLLIPEGMEPSIPLKSFPTYTTKDIFEYADMLFSSKANLMTESGGQALSSALRDTGTFSCITTQSFNDRIFVFPNVHYYVTGRLTMDFHYYPESVLV